MKGFNRSIAIVIGIADYSNNIPSLRTPIADAKRFANIVQREHGYDVYVYLNATRDELLCLLKHELPLQGLTENDRLLFYFAGHGIAEDGEDGPQGYLVPKDAQRDDPDGFLPMSVVHDSLIGLACRHALIILDCCFAGAIRWSSTRHLQPAGLRMYQERYDRYIRDPAWQVLTSAAYNQKALDALSGFAIGKRGDGESYSPFARALFSGLVGEPNGKYRADVDGVITATSLYSYLRNTLEPELLKQGHRQTPGLWPLRKHDLGEFVFLKPGHKGELEFAPKLTKDTNPYLALASYEEDDRHLFFGRDKSIQELRDKVLAQPLTVVVGASGIGKSSLVKAGLVPALRESEEMNWEITAALRPGKSPVDTLRSLQLSPSETNEPVLSLVERIKKWRQTNLNTGLVIVIDQFEELITQCTNEESRQEFVRQLEEAVESCAEYLRLVLTIRSDFEPHFSGTAFKREWKHSRFIVLPMSQDELRKAIEGPARERVLFFKPDTLVDTLINDVLHTPSALPLLSYTLSELYRSYLKRQGMNRELLLEDYEALGGVAGTLRNRANEEYEKLSEPERETMRRVMLRMVSYEGSVIARRRVPRTELDYADEKENKRVDLVLDRLSEARLVVRSEEDEKAVVEPAHDVLIRDWDKLSNWVSREEEGLSGGQRRRLREDAERWHTQVKAIALLGNRNDYLSLAISQRNQEPFSFNGVESAFISASEERQRVLNRRVWASVTLTIVVAISLAVLFWVLSQLADNRAQIAESRRLASQSQIESQSRLTLGNLLAIEAITANNTAEAESSLLTALQRQPALLTQHSLHRKSASQMMVQSVAVSPNGRWVGSVGADRTLVLLDLANKRQVKQIPLELDGSADALAFHPENKIAVISGIGGLLVSVDLESGQQKQLSASGLNIVEDLAFSPDGKWLVACGQDPQIIIWNWQNDPATAIPFNNIEEETNHIRVNALRLAFSPDGRSLAVAGSDGNVRLYSLAERKQIQLFAHDPNGLPIRAIAFNGPAQLASIGTLGDLRFWDVGTGQQQPGKLAGRPNQEAFSLAFSDDEQLLAIGTDAPSIEVWHLYSGRLLHELSFHSKSISKVAFRPQSKQLVSGGYDGVVGIWELSTFQTLATPLWAGEPFLGTAGFTPDGQYLVAASSDRLMIWKNIDSLQKKVPAQEPLNSKEMNFRTLGFSADKPVVAAGGEEYLFVCDLSNNKSSDIDVNKDRGQVVAIQLYDAARRAQIVRRSGYWQEWDLENQQLIREHKFTSSDNVIFASIRSSDGALAWQTDKNLRFSRRAADGTFSPGEVIENAGDIAQVEFSPNGQYLGWSRDDGTVSWLRVEDQSGAVRRVRVEGRYPVLRFNHSGSLLAAGYSLAKTTGYGSGNVTFFNVETSQQLGVPLSNIIFNSVGSKIEDVIRSISFTPDDKWLVSYSDRAGPVLWDISREGWLERSRMLADRNFTCDEWLQFFGTDVTYHKTITDLPFAENMDQCPLPNVNKYRYLLPAVLVIWIPLALLIVPWSPPRELLSHGLTSIILMLFVLGAVIVLWSAPQLEIEKSLPILGAQVLRLFIFSIITIVCAWAQWYLDLEWRKFRSRNLPANALSHRNS